MFNQKLYQVRLTFCTINVMAFDLKDAKVCVQEMHPNSNILSIVEVPMKHLKNTPSNWRINHDE